MERDPGEPPERTAGSDGRDGSTGGTGRDGSTRTDRADDADLVAIAERAAEDYETVELPDGRDLAYAEFGDPDGEPVVLFHGWPSSRCMGAPGHREAVGAGARVICPDRPGIGGSDPLPGRRVADWPDDVAALADALELDEFYVQGVSGGGPYAVATAAMLPDRIRAAALVCPVGPPGSGSTRFRILSGTARYLPPVARLLLGWQFRDPPEDPAEIARLRAEMDEPPDVEAWTTEPGRALAVSGRVAVESGAGPLVTDMAAMGRPWSFDPGDVEVPVTLWHGEADPTVPPSMGRAIADALPDPDAHFLPGEGHLTLPFDHLDEVTAELLSY